MTSGVLSPSQRESLERATSAYEAHVDEVAGYLTARGITRETARMYRLGYVAKPMRGDDEFAGRLAIPYITTTGVIDIRYRTVNNEEPKYLSRGGAKTHLFGVTALTREGSSIAITEGEIDCMTLNQCGINAVGVPGATQWRDFWPLMFSDYDEVVVVCDGDKAGRDFGRKVAEKLEGVVVIHMPDGMDVNEVYVQEGQDALVERIGGR